MKKVNIFYFNKTRNDGTAFYSWHAMNKLSKGEGLYTPKNEKFGLKFYLPPDGKFAPIEKISSSDFNFYVDWDEACFGGCEYIPPSPNAVWWIDSHLNKEYRIKRALQFDKVYLAQLNDVEVFKKAGCEDVEWLPLAACPENWKPEAIVKKYDVCFIGFLNSIKRMDHLDRLFKEFPEFFYGVKFWDKANKKINQSRIFFNVSIKDDVNMRFFEGMSTGVPLLTNRIFNNGMELLANEDEHYFGYKSMDEMIEKAHFILNNKEKAKEVGEAASKLIKEVHTYEHRMVKVLKQGGIL